MRGIFRSTSLVLILLLSLVLVGCGGEDGDKPVKVLLHNNPFNEGLKELEAKFEEDTGIKVDIDVVGQDVGIQRTELDFTGKTGDIDVVYMSFVVKQKWAKAGWVESLNEYVENAEELNRNDFIETTLDAMSYEDELYGLPGFAEVGLMGYRKDIFEKHGIDSPPENWDEFSEVVEKIQSNETAAVALRGQRGQGLNMFVFPMFMNSMGGGFFKDFPKDLNPILNSKENIEALKYYENLVKNYSPSGAGNYSYPDIVSAYQQGKAAISLDGTSIITQFLDEENNKYADQTGIALIPGGKSGASPMIAVHGLALSKFSNNKEEAFEFIKWATSFETQKEIALNQNYSDFTRLSVSQDEEVKAKFNIANGEFLEIRNQALEQADGNYRPLLPEWGEIGDIIAIEVNSVTSGNKSAENALEDANNKVKETLKRNGYNID
ncbi:extracellular solute-binding protein [Sporosarcina sp. Marseille-Q4063]|uniref:extracellular solute-binding protein n=1 Tax=Sporosarcina sp. Marseille-Q4063 TaxID=2810514 RepID=UPI001BAF7264|nr:extracellular solute-binding protein [Sporosarcina sp. Marseille-Q4063]QUW21263.1 extracellular solute-binding protein [Sporosarcina sp. Marseille-Q4063]